MFDICSIRHRLDCSILPTPELTWALTRWHLMASWLRAIDNCFARYSEWCSVGRWWLYVGLCANLVKASLASCQLCMCYCLRMIKSDNVTIWNYWKSCIRWHHFGTLYVTTIFELKDKTISWGSVVYILQKVAWSWYVLLTRKEGWLAQRGWPKLPVTGTCILREQSRSDHFFVDWELYKRK